MSTSIASTSQPLNVVIIGAGIAGTAAAAVLRARHNVSVLERGHPDQIGGGQAIGLGPNATKILEPLGFKRENVKAVVGRGMCAYDGKTGKMIKKIPLDVKNDFGADWLMHLRSSVRREILRLATEEMPGKRNTVIRYETNVTDIDPETGVVTIEGGEKLESDLIIVGDGIHTRLRKKVITAEPPVLPTGQSIFRFVVSAKNAKDANAGQLPPWWTPQDGGGYINIARIQDGTNRAIITYPCEDFGYVNFSCACPSSALKETATESWFADGKLEEVKEVFKDFSPGFLNLIKQAEELKVWELRDHDPLPGYVRGRAVLVGDAAHAMAPFQGQGASQAVEDAEGFSLLLDPIVDREKVPAILKQWERVRLRRGSQVQLNTRVASSALNETNSFQNMHYNWKYSGIHKALEQLENGEEI